MRRSGHAGPYFKVLNCDSKYALSLLVCGRECDCEIFISQRHCERCRAAIGVDEKTIGINTVCENCFPDKHGGERACFAAGKSPSNNTSAVQIKNGVEVVLAAECGRKFSDVPSPNLV